MAVIYNAATRTARMNEIVTAVDAGAGAGVLVIGTASMAADLVSFTLAGTSGTVSGDVLTFAFAASPADATASATGTAAAAEIRTSTGTVIVSGLTVATSGANVTIDNTSIVSGQTVRCTAAALTHDTTGT